MANALDEFCRDTRAILQSKPLWDALPLVADRLGVVLCNPNRFGKRDQILEQA